jgi:outer membrane lipoprotein SlyB
MAEDVHTPGASEHETHATTGGAAAAGALVAGAIGLTGGPLAAAVGAVGGAIIGAAAERMMHGEDDRLDIEESSTPRTMTDDGVRSPRDSAE